MTEQQEPGSDAQMTDEQRAELRVQFELAQAVTLEEERLTASVAVWDDDAG